MDHVNIAVENSFRSDITRRLAGQFYTPDFVCRLLAHEALSTGVIPNVIADPFCGDGRLIVHWIDLASTRTRSALAGLERIILWDYDAQAVATARENVAAAIRRAGLTCKIEADTLDTFQSIKRHRHGIDLVLTNPPWDLLKPDSRDAISNAAASHFKVALRNYSRELSYAFPGACSEKGKVMGGAHVNLARAGALASIDLLTHGSFMGIVLPASIFCDQASAPFRSELFRQTRILTMHYFPAEQRAFTGVDQPFVVVVAEGDSRTTSFSLVRADENRTMVKADETGLEPVPLVVGASHLGLIHRIERKHLRLRMLECDMRFGLWLGRELDETRITEAFSHNDGVPFLKGRQVDRFAIREHQPPRISPTARLIPQTVKEHRFAWRDVSRPNQKRRIQAAIVPDGWVTGNSLGVGFFRYGGQTATHTLLAVLNSFVFELQLRAKLHTPHVSLGVLRECSLPAEAFDNQTLFSRLASLTHALLSDADPALETRIEVEIARAYGLSRDEFDDVLNAFPKVTDIERRELLKKDLWA